MNTLFFILLISLSFRQECISEAQYQCELSFEIANAGFLVKGTLGATILRNSFDPFNLDQSRVTIMADPSTIDTGISIRDKHLQRADYFDTMKYPGIKLESRSFKKTGRDKFSGKFLLSIKDTTKEIEVPFTMTQKKARKTFRGSFTISRTEFGIGESSITLADDVLINFNVF